VPIASEDARNRANRATLGMRKSVLIEKGVVRSVEGEMVTVEVLPSSPESCASCGSCADSPAGRTIELRSTMDLSPGQRVELEVKGVGELGPAAAVFLLPVTAILIGAVLGNQVLAWYPDLDLSPTLAGVLGALAVAIPVIVAIRLYDRAYGRRVPRVRILRTRG
jgi:positive regulator of sigma E activity